MKGMTPFSGYKHQDCYHDYEVMLRLLKGYPDPWKTLDSHGSIGIPMRFIRSSWFGRLRDLFREVATWTKNTGTRWFKPWPFHPLGPSWRSLIPLTRSQITIPKRSQKITRYIFIEQTSDFFVLHWFFGPFFPVWNAGNKMQGTVPISSSAKPA